jgi:hypothetical protein
VPRFRRVVSSHARVLDADYPPASLEDVPRSRPQIHSSTLSSCPKLNCHDGAAAYDRFITALYVRGRRGKNDGYVKFVDRFILTCFWSRL